MSLLLHFLNIIGKGSHGSLQQNIHSEGLKIALYEHIWKLEFGSVGVLLVSLLNDPVWRWSLTGDYKCTVNSVDNCSLLSSFRCRSSLYCVCV